MSTDHYRINVAVPTAGTLVQNQRFVHHFVATIDGIGPEQEEKARQIARELKTLYPAGCVTVTFWRVRGEEVVL